MCVALSFRMGKKFAHPTVKHTFIVTRRFPCVLFLVFACQIDGLLGEDIGQDKHRQNAGFSKRYLLFNL